MRNLTKLHFLTIPAILLAIGIPASATPISGTYFDRSDGCDFHGPLTFADELGDQTVFPVDEAIMVTSTLSAQPGHFLCNSDDGSPNDYVVSMFNASGQAWKDVFFVADEGVTFTNYDGDVEDDLMPGRTRAMRIDNVGTNQPLISGDVNNDLIFDPGEFWMFLVDNFDAPGAAPPAFFSVGKFSASSGVGFDTVSTASILVNPVPEPTHALSLLALGGVGLATRRCNART